MGRVIRALIFLAAVTLFFVVVGFAFVIVITGDDVVSVVRMQLAQFTLASRQEALNLPLGTDANTRRFVVNLGDHAALIGQNLVQNSLIRDAELFVDYVRATGLDRQLEAGVYFLSPAMTIPQIAQRLTDSRSSSLTFTVLSGMRLEEIAELIDRNRTFGFTGADFLRVTSADAPRDPAFVTWVGLPVNQSLEGFMFPDTYLLPPDLSAEGLRDVLLQTFMSKITPQMMSDLLTQGWTLYEIVTLASIIERESLYADENAMIASVYRNRLEVGMRLEADPTVQYALNGSRGVWWSGITFDDLRGVNSVYNTYLNTGLPPSPIASPSLEAIVAAIYPETSGYYFFHTRCDGSGYHNFAETYDEHLANRC